MKIKDLIEILNNFDENLDVTVAEFSETSLAGPTFNDISTIKKIRVAKAYVMRDQKQPKPKNVLALYYNPESIDHCYDKIE